MRIIIEINDLRGEAAVTTETSFVPDAENAGAEAQATGPGGVDRQAVDAGPPAEDGPGETVRDTAVGGQAIDAGTARAAQGLASDEQDDVARTEAGGPVDAGEAPDVG